MKNDQAEWSINEAIEAFLVYQKTNYPFETYRNRAWSLSKLKRYLEREGVTSLCQLTAEVLIRYEEEKPALFKPLRPHSQQVSRHTLKLDTTNLRMFLIYLYNRELLLEDLSLHITARRGGPNLSKPLPPRVIKEWFSLCDLSLPTGLRDRAFFELCYGSGLRLGEALALRVCDLDLGESQVVISDSKNGEPRLVPLTRTSSYYLKKYLSEARSWMPKSPRTENCLWLTTQGTNLKRRTMQNRILRLYRPRLSCGTPITLHRLRHSCATHLLRGGASVRHVQELLGHRSINSTQLYTKVAIPDLQDAFRRHHPRSRS